MSGKKAARLGDIGSAHGCFPPTPIIGGSADIIVNHRAAARKGDPLLLHGCGNCPPHPRSISAGSSTVIFNHKPASRVGDAIGCGGSISTGSGDVIIGDQGLQAPDQPCLEAAKAAGAALVQIYPESTDVIEQHPPPPGLLAGLISAQESGSPVVSVRSEELKSEDKGKIDHTTPEEADKLIRKYLSEDAKNSIRAGKQITGKAKIVGEPEWSKAGENHYGKNKWRNEKVDRLNGFVDRNGNVWVHKDRGNPGTMIHEGIHKYSDNAVIRVSQPLNEGMTEYYTRKITNAENMASARRNYQQNYKATEALADLVGEEKISKAYFSGNVNQLKDAVDSKLGSGTWNKFVDLSKKNQWTEAKRLLYIR